MECSSMVSTHRFSRNIIHPSVESIRALSSSSWEEKNKKPGGTAAGQAHIAVALLSPGFLCIGISQVGRFAISQAQLCCHARIYKEYHKLGASLMY